MKHLKPLFALLLVLALTCSMLACNLETPSADAGNNGGSASGNSDGGSGGGGSGGGGSAVDTSFEDALEALLADPKNVTVTSNTVTNCTVTVYGQTFDVHVVMGMSTKYDENGNYTMVNTQENSLIMGGEEQPLETSVITVTQIGNTFYVESGDSSDPSFLLSATDEEIANLEDDLLGGEEGKALLETTAKDFAKITSTTDGDGNKVYTCKNLKSSVAEVYSNMMKELLASNEAVSDVSMLADTFVYTVTVDSDNRVISSVATVDISATMVFGNESVPCVYEVAVESTFDYAPVTVKAPSTTTGWWMEMTLTEYMNIANDAPVCTGSHTDENNNGICDKCPTRLD